ncbi:hypothetical protein FcAc13_12080, partial [Frischella sp. Ac13]
MALNYISYQANSKLIKDLDIPVHMKEVLRMKNRSILVNSVLSGVQIASSLSIFLMGYKHANNINLVASTELLSNMKGVYLIGKVAGAAASFIAIVDGLVACVKDLPRFYAGDSGALGFQIGSIMEITAGVLGLFALAGLCFPGIGWVILGLAVVGMLLKGQFSDDSDSW